MGKALAQGAHSSTEHARRRFPAPPSRRMFLPRRSRLRAHSVVKQAHATLSPRCGGTDFPTPVGAVMRRRAADTAYSSTTTAARAAKRIRALSTHMAGANGPVAVTISGWRTCGYFQRAKTVGNAMNVLYPERYQCTFAEFETKGEFKAWLPEIRQEMSPWGVADSHSSSPFTWRQDGGASDPVKKFVGGCDDTLQMFRNELGAPLSALEATPESGVAVPDIGEGASFDYDLVVIGGGSGGLSCAKAAADLGQRVLVADFIKPSATTGTTWGLGGTCVNVGCIPKKLMHQAALLGSAANDAPAFGWSAAAEGRAAHDWSAMVASVQEHIVELNRKSEEKLVEKNVTYANSLATFVDPHTVSLSPGRRAGGGGAAKNVSARRIVVAVGGRPTPLVCPGAELAITSDDLFSLPRSPGRTLIVGASYIALECAGFLAGLGLEVTVLVRSILLRGFDRDIAERIGSDLEDHGVRFVNEVVPQSIESAAGDAKRVRWGGEDPGDAGEGEFDTVLAAIGRRADTGGLNLDAAGVAAEGNGKIACRGEQSNVPHIYAIGDVLHGRPELTPVAAQAGKLLAERLYKLGGSAAMDYRSIATTVFTPLEYGCVGLSEEEATAELGANLAAYHVAFTPLEWSVVKRRGNGSCYAKLLVDTSAGGKVAGLHYLGPNAGEVVQGFAVAMRMGATYDDFMHTVGIHPTCAEKFTTLTITKTVGSFGGAPTDDC